MRNNAICIKITPTSLLAGSLPVVLLLAAIATAQAQQKVEARLPCVGCSTDGKATPKMPDGHPNLNGFWNTPPKGVPTRQVDKGDDGSILFEFSINFDETIPGTLCLDDSCQVKNQPPYNDEWMKKVKALAAEMYLGTSGKDPEMACKPNGIPRTGIGATQIVQTPELIAVLYEAAPSSIWRMIYLDGRPLPDDLDGSYMGYSQGHWEGDTLVVVTTAFNDDTWLGAGGHGRSKYTSIHSDKMKTIERWNREGNMLTVATTVEDPEAFTRPWVLAPRRVQMSNPGDYIHESICSQVNMSGIHMIKPTDKDQGQLLIGTKANSVQ
jgi:hypothetical protein